MYYTECSYCGATLDPGEKCDCKESMIEDVRERYDDSGGGQRHETQ